MNGRVPSWDLFNAFLAVMRTGSLSSAARALEVAQPTVRRHIEELEAALGCVLFSRSHAGLLPTEVALEALPYAETMAATADALLRSASAADRSAEQGIVRITCSEIVGAEVLPPILASFRQQYPSIEIELAPTDRIEDLLRRDADVAVRMARPSQAALVAKRVGAVELGLFASDAYLAGHAAPRRPSDLVGNHVLIGDDRQDLVITALNAAGLNLSRRDFAYRTDSGLGQLAAIRAGIGIGACQVPLAAERGRPLVRILPGLRFDLDAWVVMHEDMKRVRRTRLMFDHLAAGLAVYMRGPPRHSLRPRSTAPMHHRSLGSNT